MGYEYQASIEPAKGVHHLDEIRDALRKEPEVEVLPQLDLQCIHLRWTSHPLNPKWPEDTTISLTPNCLIVTVHGGNEKARAALLETIKLATKLQFEEL